MATKADDQVAEGTETTTEETEEQVDEAKEGADDFKLDGEGDAEKAVTAESDEGEGDDKGSEDGNADDKEEETGPIDVSIGDATPASPAEDEGPAPGWAKELRKKNREQAQRIRQLEAAQATRTTIEQPPVLVPKPKPSDPDVDYDAAKLEAKMAAHFESKAKVDKWNAEQKAKQDQQQEVAKKIWDDYRTEKAKLRARAEDFDDAEETVAGLFDETQQSTIVQSMLKKAPLVILALHRDPKEAKRLAAIKDPIRLAAALGAIEEKISVKSRHPTTRPATPVRGGSGHQSNLKALEAKAATTKDYTDLFNAEDAIKKAQKK